jgi:hypothetical protein
MMWPIFWPDDTDFTNPANTRHPSEDVSAAAKYTSEQIARVVAATGTSGDPDGYELELSVTVAAAAGGGLRCQ